MSHDQEHQCFFDQNAWTVRQKNQTLNVNPIGLGWLRDGDEVCRREATGEQLMLRLERAARRAKAAVPANVDSLTGLADRRGIEECAAAQFIEQLADTAGRDSLIADFENRLRVTTARMTGARVLKARRLAGQHREESDHDGLTKISNCRHLDRLLPREAEKARKLGRHLTVGLLDLDYFGAINRTYGCR